MTIDAGTYTQLPKFSLWDSDLKQINDGLRTAVFSPRTKMISIQGETFPLQEVINKVYQLMPPSNQWSNSLPTYLSVAKKIRSATNVANVEEQPGYCLELLAIFKRAFFLVPFSCCGCTDACREEQILSDSYLTEAEWLEPAPPEALGNNIPSI